MKIRIRADGPRPQTIWKTPVAAVVIRRRIFSPAGRWGAASVSVCRGGDSRGSEAPAFVFRVPADYMQPMTAESAAVPTIDEITDAFALIDDWEERYRYVIELGRQLAPLRPDQRTEDHRVKGCASNVWLVTHVADPGPDAVLTFEGESDAHIVKGLIAVTLAYYSGRPARWIVEHDAYELFRSLGFEQHLTPQRSNGVRAMIERIRQDAQRALAG